MEVALKEKRRSNIEPISELMTSWRQERLNFQTISRHPLLTYISWAAPQRKKIKRKNQDWRTNSCLTSSDLHQFMEAIQTRTAEKDTATLTIGSLKMLESSVNVHSKNISKSSTTREMTILTYRKTWEITMKKMKMIDDELRIHMRVIHTSQVSLKIHMNSIPISTIHTSMTSIC